MRRSLVPLFCLALSAAQAVRAQEAAPPPPAAEAVDPATVPMPALAFTPTAGDIDNYDKYFYFNRPETDFATAYADLQECHGYASGISLSASGGVLTGGVTGVAVDAIVGSALRRDLRRRNLRTCMRFKEYRVYGLPKPLWEQFNSHEDHARLGLAEWQRLLGMQARLASGPRPQIGEVTQ